MRDLFFLYTVNSAMDSECMQIILLSLIAGGSLFFLMNKAIWYTNQKIEHEFIVRHRVAVHRHLMDGRKRRHTPDKEVFLRLTFPQRETEYLTRFCKLLWGKWNPRHYLMKKFNLKTYQPSVQNHYLIFTTVAEHYAPIGVEVIRCSEQYALMDIGNGSMGYVLEKYLGDDYEEHDSREFFYIRTKFNYSLRDEDLSESVNTGKQGARKKFSPKTHPALFATPSREASRRRMLAKNPVPRADWRTVRKNSLRRL